MSGSDSMRFDNNELVLLTKGPGFRQVIYNSFRFGVAQHSGKWNLTY